MKDGYTRMLTDKINDWGLDKIYEMEDDIYGLEGSVPEIIDYLKDIHFSMPLGLVLRRYICEKFSSEFDSEKQSYIFKLPDGRVIITKNYMNEGYDIENDDIPEYIELFNYINAKYNSDENGVLLLEFPKAEVRRQLRATTGCIRKKMFLLSFALHMDNEYTSKFLTDVLAEQTYNYREPNEIIAYFCQSDEAHNNYGKYIELCNLFASKAKDATITEPAKDNYTSFAKTVMAEEIKTEEMLIDFLLANVSNFHVFSQTAYREYVFLYKKASELLTKKSVNIDLKDKSEAEQFRIIKSAIDDDKLVNPELMARKMLACVPRATTKRVKDEKMIVSNDFISIYNGENGQDSKKVKTTDLPKKITTNLPVSDRLWDLLRRDKPIDRKDLVFMKFYVLFLYLQEKEAYSSDDYFVFMEECNALLVRCGMSRLYPGNRFENLIMLSLLATYPFEMFENIIEYSFMNEPKPDEAEE